MKTGASSKEQLLSEQADHLSRCSANARVNMLPQVSWFLEYRHVKHHVGDHPQVRYASQPQFKQLALLTMLADMNLAIGMAGFTYLRLLWVYWTGELV